MSDSLALFGARLRFLRLAARLSLTDMSRLVFYSRSHLSKVENGIKPPSSDLAMRCDALLGCEGELVRLAQRPPSNRPATGPTGDSGVWVLRLDPSGGSSFTTGGSAKDPAIRPPPLADYDGSTLGQFRMIFQHVRDLGQRLGSDVLMPMLVTHTHALRGIAEQARGADQQYAFLLAARFAEYAGWIVQEAGDDAYALWWTDRAVELSTAAGDDGMAAYALVRRALITMYQRDAPQTIALARQAQMTQCGARIRGLAAQREAQGHALAGDHKACMSALDRARVLLAKDPGDGPVIGTSHVTDPAALVHGWTLLDLGRPGQSAAVLREELARIPVQARRTRARYGARLARALAGSAQLEEACALADEVLDDYQQVRSATIRTDLRALAGTLRRWHTQAEAQRIGLRLTTVLHGSAS